MQLSNLKLSLSNLLREFGSTDNILVGVGLNLTLAAVGVLLWWLTSGLVSYLGVFWAIVNVLGVVKWVFRA